MTAVLDPASPHTAAPGVPGAPAVPALREFDGVVCFGGEDWWYHNRGHFDMQLMRELSAHVPVLYINSIGMRVPRATEGAMFLRRVRRKLASLRRGLVRVRDRFAVDSPLAIPGRLGSRISRRLLPAQLRRSMRALGIRRPLVWVACPPGAPIVDALNPIGVVYQRTDRYEAFSGVDPDQIKGFDRALKSRADLTIFCSRSLFNDERAGCNSALFVDHGVDYDRFESAGRAADSIPDDARAIARPRIGFIGGIDAHTFDPPLFVEIARRLPRCNFMLVGACSLPEGWCPLTNVTMLGQRPYDEVARYMAACDVLIMPWNDSPWIKACNPVKLKEYLAVGRPVVSTPFDELANYEGLVRVARGGEAFAAAIETALASPGDPAQGRERVRRETWTAKGAQVLSKLAEFGLRPSLVSGATHRAA